MAKKLKKSPVKKTGGRTSAKAAPKAAVKAVKKTTTRPAKAKITKTKEIKSSKRVAPSRPRSQKANKEEVSNIGLLLAFIFFLVAVAFMGFAYNQSKIREFQSLPTPPSLDESVISSSFDKFVNQEEGLCNTQKCSEVQSAITKKMNDTAENLKITKMNEFGDSCVAVRAESLNDGMTNILPAMYGIKINNEWKIMGNESGLTTEEKNELSSACPAGILNNVPVEEVLIP